ncbi:hypothetical protein HGM15179_013916 [Zosterops borbonicus]|uniref:Uncharacterized protein n=1 Tax=Zosterops borbonicus TaxID=364589 RepID=A0A8K1LGV9_9PASS|nr:hypothetical protein HGM15179_013916 [Zosterops borbonicus]
MKDKKVLVKQWEAQISNSLSQAPLILCKITEPLGVGKTSKTIQSNLCLIPTLSPAQSTECNTQGWGLQTILSTHSNSLHEKILPDVPTERSLVQLEAISSHPITFSLGAEPDQAIGPLNILQSSYVETKQRSFQFLLLLAANP